MTTTKISALTDLGAAPASTDLVPIVDVSDTTQAASGSTKKNLVSDFFAWLLDTVRVFTAKPTFAGGIAIRDTGDDHLISIDTATNEAADRTITIPALGGNVTLSFIDLAQTFTAQKVFETGAAGASPAIFRQTGGVAGTDELQLSCDGTDSKVESKTGVLHLLGATAIGIKVDNDSGVVSRIQCSGGPSRLGIVATTVELNYWKSNATTGSLTGVSGTYALGWTSRAVMTSPSDGVIKITDNAETGGGQLEMLQSTDVGTPNTNCGRIGAEDVAGTAEVIVSDEAGTETQISEHRSDGPAWLYDDVAATGMLDRIEYERQRYLGTHRYKNISRRDRKQSGLNETTKRVLLAIVNQLGIVLPAEDMAILREPSLEQTCEHMETLAEYGVRRPEKAVIQKRDWATDQAAKQANYDADRQAEMDRVAKLQADHAKALSDYEKLPAAEKAKRPAPVAPELPAVRPAKDIKKPKPSWLK